MAAPFKIFSKKRQCDTVEAATASLQQTLADLQTVAEDRAANAVLKAEQIAALEKAKVDDEAEAAKAERVMLKLKDLFS